MKRIIVPSIVLSVSLLSFLTLAQFSSWSPWFSEENPPQNCGRNQIITGLAASGQYSDNLKIKCTSKPYTLPNQVWTARLSEENREMRCPQGYAVSGIACYGSYCDKMSLQCTQISKIPNSCTDVPRRKWISEEKDRNTVNEVQLPGNSYIIGMKCSGRYCDNMKLITCNE